MSQEGFEKLADAMDKLTLNDASVTVKKENSVALGPGFRCGFLGMLHMDVFMQRLMDEHGSEVRNTAPPDADPVLPLPLRTLLSCCCGGCSPASPDEPAS